MIFIHFKANFYAISEKKEKSFLSARVYFAAKKRFYYGTRKSAISLEEAENEVGNDIYGRKAVRSSEMGKIK